MISIIVATAVALFITLFFTPVFIKLLERKHYGQFIREDGPTSHLVKRGTPTMGGVIIIGATVLGFLVGNLVSLRIPSVSGWLIIFLLVGLGLIGFLDDFTKISKERSLGLSPRAKMIGQGLVGILFSVGALQFANEHGQTPATLHISLVRDTPLTLGFAGIIAGTILFILWTNFLISAWSNAVNLTDGLDGLAAGASAIAFGSYAIINIWQSYQRCGSALQISPGCYDARDPRDLAIFCAAVVGACLGFIWHNTSPAKIFMGDTGSLALGGAFAGISILSQTEMLAIFIGGLFVVIVISDVIQIGFFKATGRRVFRMAPLHHHFELKGWKEVTIVVRFWLIQIFLSAIGIGLFYAEWLARQ
ncbi:phospho-N-acetylmuramoyl-pentapeptide-transferase [Arcanobacterium hippocoleae]|uniref:Phospho-N-acetylmuramoyl-pentapeptide-transferase n=1 Tax=Arcanobacterium hippocoleae TaxID=149017 RepID=A0ABU1T131_9ACTO|nr:phospho-N-acetylmuramoyl-pentapeptide-transferase [Arcanobacterium hippocoleae]MDR6939005.1 phospho-N-acetylmuramoyl-pentapeptide-transferase [Arcanobacterium hippocoleae]